MTKILLDTHILLWWFGDGGRLSPDQKQALQAADKGSPLLVSDISLWEIATFHMLGRIRLALPLREWLEAAVSPPLVQLKKITPAIASEVAALPDSFHRDPADRIIVATARVLGIKLMTADQRIITADLVPTIV